jgi:ADP-ribosylglycohydrolase
VAAITGGIAEAYYGVPEVLIVRALSYLDSDLLEIIQQWK